METEDEVLEVIPENDYSKDVPITDDQKDQFFETLEDESQETSTAESSEHAQKEFWELAPINKLLLQVV